MKMTSMLDLTFMSRTNCGHGIPVTSFAVSVIVFCARVTSSTDLSLYSSAGLNSLGASLANPCRASSLSQPGW